MSSKTGNDVHPKPGLLALSICLASNKAAANSVFGDELHTLCLSQGNIHCATQSRMIVAVISPISVAIIKGYFHIGNEINLRCDRELYLQAKLGKITVGLCAIYQIQCRSNDG